MFNPNFTQMRWKAVTGIFLVAILVILSTSRRSLSSDNKGGGKSVHLTFLNSTQGPLWPPSSVVDKDGNFILLGTALLEVSPGVVAPVINQALLISKDTVPPLDAEGRENFSNPLGAPYKVIRPLDLSPGSPDLEMELYSASFGPFEGDFGGGPRIPRLGESKYNLSMARTLCREVTPTASQSRIYNRPSFPLHRVPINGFIGDQIAYDVETGMPIDPHTKSGPDCGDGCPGENNGDHRRETPITLGEWLKAKGEVTITLTKFNEEVNAYTAARFDFNFKDLLPNAVYSVNAVRLNTMLPPPYERVPSLAGIPNVFMTDEKGNAKFSTEMINPFPDPATDVAGMRVKAVGVIYHSDYQNWGACPSRLGPGVDVHGVINTSRDGRLELGDFITKEPPKGGK